MTASPSTDALPSGASSTPPPAPQDLAAPAAQGAEDAVAADEAAAWAEVLAGWGDEARHRAYLSRFHDLDGLANAGRRYREVLAARPRDAIAGRFRDEVIRRAMAQGLASLPRTEPGAPRAKLAIRVAAGAVIAALLAATAVMLARVLPFVSGGAQP